MTQAPSDPFLFQTDFSKYCYGEIDAEYASGSRLGAFDLNLIRDFLDYVGYGTTVLTMMEYLKKFIQYLEAKKGGSPENAISGRAAKPGELKLYREGPRNVIFIEGEGKPRPILEVCELRPLFHIQRGFILALKNVRIQFKGSPDGLILEASGPSFVFDPENVTIERVDECKRTPGNFIIDQTIWIGDPKRGQKNRKTK